MTATLITALTVTGVTQLAALVFIIFRYAIPRSPNIFHALCVLGLLPSSIAAFVLAYDVIAGDLKPELFLTVFFVAEAATFTVLDAYAVYHHLVGRHKRRG